jgi:hypothetical protein
VPVVVGTVRGEVENAPDGNTFDQASHQLAALGKSIPEGPLRIDVDRANFDLTQFWLRLSSGGGTKYAKAFAVDLRRLDSDCA